MYFTVTFTWSQSYDGEITALWRYLERSNIERKNAERKNLENRNFEKNTKQKNLEM
jgi:hypothetical protein